ncbi:thioredoxin family protein [Melghirimyces algeriensis]|uniref:Thioredoxin n=1 Tax=Melghirimyces algeriensis TaxID=910412 RepID=A0A521FDP7_9BACL|nr:thioredoxin family protein [Melghirimyces algeriensis]SMO94322.1 Thioredoxin [Melghirimyces algeriensis]
MDLNEWFDKGMSGQEYIDSMNVNRKELLHIYQQFSLSDEDIRLYERLKKQQLRGIVLTADWCGDAMLCVPILMRIAEAAQIEMRYLIRDENLELMDQYLTNGKSRSIPIFIFIDQQGEEQAVWGPRAPEVQRLVDELKESFPSADDPEFEQKRKELYQGLKVQLVNRTDLWEAVHRSVKETLQMLDS